MKQFTWLCNDGVVHVPRDPRTSHPQFGQTLCSRHVEGTARLHNDMVPTCLRCVAIHDKLVAFDVRRGVAPW